MKFLAWLFLIAATFSGVVSAQEVACPELTGLQVAAGFVTWINILRVFAIVGIVGALAVLGWKWFGWLLQIFLAVPVQVYEILGYLVSAGLLVAAYWVAPADQLWFTLGGSLLFGAMLVITSMVHKLEPNYERFFGTLFLVWGCVAVVYQSMPVGFIAVGAFMGMLGFSAAVIPAGYLIGFRNESDLSRATSAAFLVLGAFVVLRFFPEVPFVHVFETGALWFGSFVGYLGLLIASSRWYNNRRSYPGMQFITIVAGFAALVLGAMLDIPELLGVGGTFFVLYLIEKPYEIPAESVVGYATITLVVSGIVGVGVWWAQHNMDLIEPYLLF